MPPPSPQLLLGNLRGLSRYPVKSVVGEDLDRVFVDRRGLLGDRLWAVRDTDGKLGSGKSTRRFRKMDGLLSISARYDRDARAGDTDVPVLDLPGGRRLRGDAPGVHDALSAVVGRPVRLAREVDVSHFDDGPIHLLTTASLLSVGRAHQHAVDVQRLRPNLVVETDPDLGLVEQRWIGASLRIGADLVLAIRAAMPRCVMIDLPQLGLPPEHGLLRTVTELDETRLGVVADVLEPGEIAVGDPVRLV